MGLSHNTKASGAVYFHRFYMFHSFQTFPREAGARWELPEKLQYYHHRICNKHLRPLFSSIETLM